MAGSASLGGGSPAAWWFSILTLGPLLGSLITEPAAMTICALLLARRFYQQGPSPRFAYATLGLLFVNISVGGTLTHFAAPPVLMVAGKWGWGGMHMLTHFGWKAVAGILAANIVYALYFRHELAALKGRDAGEKASEPKVPGWVTFSHMLFLVWTVMNSHYPALFIGGFLFYLGFLQATEHHQSDLQLRPALLVGFFLAGLVVHGGLQGWWIAPVLSRLSEVPLFVGAAVLTAFNDNAALFRSGHARARVQRGDEACRGGRGGGRGRFDRDSECAQSGGSIDPRPILPGRHFSCKADARGTDPDLDCFRLVSRLPLRRLSR